MSKKDKTKSKETQRLLLTQTGYDSHCDCWASGLYGGQRNLTEVNPELRLRGLQEEGCHQEEVKHPSLDTRQAKAWIQEQDSAAQCGKA